VAVFGWLLRRLAGGKTVRVVEQKRVKALVASLLEAPERTG
jgi:hypothetical protein